MYKSMHLDLWKLFKKKGPFLFGGKYEKKNISKFGYTNKKDLILSHVYI
jgi:hypothetical protein